MSLPFFVFPGTIIHWNLTFWSLLDMFKLTKHAIRLYIRVNNCHCETVLEMYKLSPQAGVMVVASRVGIQISFKMSVHWAEERWNDYHSPSSSKGALHSFPSTCECAPGGSRVPINHSQAGCVPKQHVQLRAAPPWAGYLQSKHCLFHYRMAWRFF